MILSSVYGKKIQFLTMCTLSATWVACGGSGSSANEGSSLPNSIVTDQGEVLELTEVSVDVSQQGAGLSLVGAEDFKLQIDSCASGYATAELSNPTNVSVYKFDRNCVAKLTEFTVDGIIYAPPASASWIAGEVLEYSATGGEKLNLTISATLNSPISGTESLQFSYAEIDSSTGDSLSNSDVADGHSIAVGGESAPAFLMKEVELVGIAAGGEGEYRITLECEEDLVGSASCKTQNLGDMVYKIVVDTYGGDLSLADAAALFPTDEISIAAGDIYEAGADASYPKGGFKPTVTGPGPLHSTSAMLLVIQVSDVSYRYYQISVATL